MSVSIKQDTHNANNSHSSSRNGNNNIETTSMAKKKSTEQRIQDPEDDTFVIAYILTIYTNISGVIPSRLEWRDGGRDKERWRERETERKSATTTMMTIAAAV